MRKANWSSCLAEYILEWQQKEFKWGRSDCALFAAGAVHVMTGRDLAKGLRGYRTEAGGLKKVRANGYADHVDVFAKNLPATDRPCAGDLAAIESDGNLAMGVFQGRGIYVMTPQHGLALVPNSWAVARFKV